MKTPAAILLEAPEEAESSLGPDTGMRIGSILDDFGIRSPSDSRSDPDSYQSPNDLPVVKVPMSISSEVFVRFLTPAPTPDPTPANDPNSDISKGTRTTKITISHICQQPA